MLAVYAGGVGGFLAINITAATNATTAITIAPPPPACGGGVVVTVITEALLVTPLTLAVTLAVPSATPVTKPEELTVAAIGLLLNHARIGHVIVATFRSLHTAVSGIVLPTLID